MTVIGIAHRRAARHAGRHLSRRVRPAIRTLSAVIRFVNDVLLSAPSIIIGLFVYELLVVPMGHFSAIAGAVALAMIAMPVTVRTTEDMLRPGAAGHEGCLHRAWAPIQWRTITQRHLSGRPQRHRDRPAAGRRAHQRRDRAAAVHRAQQPVLEQQPQRSRWPTCRWSSSSSP